jgi:serine phosphatase RsbU (regulator of sigma subunit)/CHASE2 domain-containing sensor protein
VAELPDGLESSPEQGWSSLPWIVRLSAGQGRAAATCLLLLLALLHYGAGEPAWSPVRNLLFDAYQRLMPRRMSHDKVVIVDIDDQSVAVFGRWPWPRTRLARLMEETHRLGALAVGLDIIMPEADDLSPAKVTGDRRDINDALRGALASLPSNDAVLADTLRRLPAVISRAAVSEESAQDVASHKQTPVVVTGDSPLPYLTSFKGHLSNLPELEAAAAGLGYLNDTRDRDGIVRAMPLVIAVGGALAPAFALELLRVATRETYYTVQSSAAGMLGIQVGDSFIPTDSDGGIRLRYSPAHAGRRVPAAAILRGELAPGALANQVALIGVTAVGISDVAATPVAARMDGVDIQAQLIENVLESTRLMRPVQVRWLELLGLVALGLLVIFFLPRLAPVYGVAIYLAGAAVLGLVSWISFQHFSVLYDPTLPAAGNGLIVALLLTLGFSASDRRRRELDAALEAARIERFRIAGELRAAREIQMGMLPDPSAIDGLRANVEFFAMLEPAQEVGGDLYDGFMLDDQRFCFLIGDVTGKGVPAALFMALTKTLCKSLARREHVPLGQLLRSVNEEMSQENPAFMFVTAVIGVIDVVSGEVDLCNAGHDAPILLRVDQPPRLLDDPRGPPLCVVEDFPYERGQFKLETNDILLLTTDGVTEAADKQYKMYGLGRLLECLSGSGRPHTAALVCEKLYADVRRFTQGAPASDDITIMALRFTAPPGKTSAR